MSYALTIGPFHTLTESAFSLKETCNCHEAKDGCTPSFVFSVEGQVGFRAALKHLASCRKNDCRQLRSRILDSMHLKLTWLMKEECLLGCVHVQPTLYGSRRIIMKRRDFPAIAHHLARCPKESCAQLRRSMLLTIRDELRPN